MCGIALLVDRAGGDLLPERLARMTAALAARGPDDEAYVLGDWETGRAERRSGRASAAGPAEPFIHDAAGAVPRWSIGLGVRRLAIRDRGARARLPMTDGRGLWLAYNGELYETESLRAELGRAGHVFHTSGDAEVLLAAWRAWGPSALERLDGMWAFAIWDTASRRVWCARDPLGIKPLYVAATPGRLVAASTPRAVLHGLGERPAPHLAAVAEYLATGLLDHGPDTCLEGIRRVGAGSLLEIGDGGMRERRWAPAPACRAARDASPHERIEAFHDALDRAVASHLVSDRPAGAMLSGGLDSATIVLSAARSRAAGTRPGAPQALSLFTAGFRGAAEDERALAAAVAARTPFPLDVVDIGEAVPRTLADDVSLFLDGLDEPVVSSSVYAQWCVMRRVADHGVRVVLDGQGADELLGGYPGLVGPALADEVLGGTPARAWAALGARADRGGGSRLGLAARGAVALLPDRFAVAAGRALRPSGALHPDLASRWHAAAPQLPPGLAPPRSGGRLAAARARLLTIHLPALLRYLDTSSMAWSVEARVPFLDRHVVAAGLALHGADLWHDGWQKWVLRAPDRSRLPDAIRLAARKRAFAAPEAAWFRGPLRAWLRDVLAPATIARQGLLAPAAVAAGLQAIEAGGDAPADIWRWANVTWWMTAR
jgi:asparagine synthase (glutamine-hydrolysing)